MQRILRQFWLSAEEGSGGESECEEGLRDEVRAGQDDDPAMTMLVVRQ